MVSTSTSNVERVSSDQGAVPTVITVGDLYDAVATLMARTGRGFPIPEPTSRSAGYLGHLLSPLLHLDRKTPENNSVAWLTTTQDGHDAAPPPSPNFSSTQFNEIQVTMARSARADNDGHNNRADDDGPNDTASCTSGSTDLVDEGLNDWSEVAAALPADAVNKTSGNHTSPPAPQSNLPVDATAAAIAVFTNGSHIDDARDDATLRWYTVTVGHNIGVFSDWPTVAPLVVGVRGACYVRYATRNEARRAFIDAIARGAVRVVTPAGALYPTHNPTTLIPHCNCSDNAGN